MPLHRSHVMDGFAGSEFGLFFGFRLGRGGPHQLFGRGQALVGCLLKQAAANRTIKVDYAFGVASCRGQACVIRRVGISGGRQVEVQRVAGLQKVRRSRVGSGSIRSSHEGKQIKSAELPSKVP
jgi:hypothetical protein